MRRERKWRRLSEKEVMRARSLKGGGRKGKRRWRGRKSGRKR